MTCSVQLHGNFYATVYDTTSFCLRITLTCRSPSENSKIRHPTWIYNKLRGLHVSWQKTKIQNLGVDSWTTCISVWRPVGERSRRVHIHGFSSVQYRQTATGHT